MIKKNSLEKYKVIVIGAGQAGLSVGYYLKKAKIPFLILDANERVGDSWRNRWDSLHLFTPAKFNGLAGLKFPAKPNYFPSKDEMADYLEHYAAHFDLPIRMGVKITGLSKENDVFCISSSDQQFCAENVVVAMSNFQVPKVPEFSKKLNPDITQLHSLDYRHPSQLQDGEVLVVGAGNSGAEVALEASRNGHKVWLAGRDTGHIPFKIEGRLSKLILARLVVRFLFHRILTTGTPIGRKARPKIVSIGGPLIRIKPKDFEAAGIIRTSRVSGASDGLPVLEDGTKLKIKNIVWCTGFYPAVSWIDIPVFWNMEPIQKRGVVPKEPGLYFTGLHFLYSFSSAMVHGTSRDARYVVKNISRRLNYA